MNTEDLKSLIREVISEMSVDDMRKMADDVYNSRPKSLKPSPEEKQEAIQQFQALPRDRKKLLARLLKHPCSYCEKEYKVPNVGRSHGICRRHKEEMYKQLGKTMPPYKGNTVDLAELFPEELQLAVRLYAAVNDGKPL